MKTCFKCKKAKKLNDFYKHSKMKDGYLNKCKECKRKDSIIYRNENKEYYLAYDRMRGALPHRIESNKKYQQSEKGRESKKRTNKKWRANNLEKIAAHTILNNRLRDGHIKKEKCKLCGSKKSMAHHEDYSKPLEVKWLCAKCHSFRHKILDLKR